MNIVSFTVTTAENLTFNLNSSANISPGELVEVAQYLTKLAATMALPAAAPATPKVA